VRCIKCYTPKQAERLEIRPGITGWAQVNGRNALSWERSVSGGRMVCGSPEADVRHPDTFQNAAQGFTKKGYFGERPCNNDGRIFRKTKITGRRRMKKLYVIGAGGFGREILTWAM